MNLIIISLDTTTTTTMMIGHLMVAVAAKEFSVPVVGVAGAFMLTPLFAHNQNAALGQLLSPSSVISYHALDPIAADNVEGE